MKTILASSLLLLSVIGGCSSGRIDTSGAHPALGKAEPMTPASREAEVDTGRLLVYEPSGYTVYEEGGLKVAHETNQGGAHAEDPVELKLAPGRYFVRLDEPARGTRDFWVTVVRGQVTRVGNRSPATVR